MYFQSATTSAPGKETLAVAEVNFSPYLKGNSNVSSIRDDDYAVRLHADADLPSFFHFHKFAWYLSGTFKNAAGLWSRSSRGVSGVMDSQPNVLPSILPEVI